MNGAPDAIVVGGGIAGLAAALRLGETGARVLLLESRRRLGGRASSFDDRVTGESLDNCQHVALGCCTAYLDLLERLGASERLVWTREQHWIERGGRASRLWNDPLPAPIHPARSFLGAKFLSVRAKADLARAVLRAMGEAPGAHAGRVFTDWLRDAGQGAEIVRRFWLPLIVSACNLSPRRVSAEAALQVLREGLLLRAEASAIALSAGPLGDLYERAPAIIASHGGEVRLGETVERVRAGGITLRSGQTLSAGVVVLAAPFEAAARMIDPETTRDDPRFAAMARLDHSPIIGVHLAFDRPVLAYPHAVLVEASTHWLFRKDEAGARVHAVISAADTRARLEPEEVVRRVVRDIRAWLPASASGAEVTWARVVKERRATFAATPASERVRPSVAGPRGARGVLLAGDYVQTGWPATMESATRAGYAAAAIAAGRALESVLPAPMSAAAVSAALGVRAVGAEGVRASAW